VVTRAAAAVACWSLCNSFGPTWPATRDPGTGVLWDRDEANAQRLLFRTQRRSGDS